MPHRRIRYLEPCLKKLLAMSPIVGVLGHRQVGKTTLLEQVCKHYYTMDLESEFLAAQKDPMAYLESRAGTLVAIDECQTVEKLFPALKEWVRTHPKPGQFILSGSVRFTSRKAIQESLTGRIINLELYPMAVSELLEESLPDFWVKALEVESFKNMQMPQLISGTKRLTAIQKYFEQGGLPGVCFIREAEFRAKKFSSQLETILDRDLRKIVPTTLAFPYLKQLAQALADRQGAPFSWSDLRSATEISIPTLKKLIFAFESIFVIRTIPLHGDLKGPVFYFEDQGELNSLRTQSQTSSEKVAHFLFTHVRTQFAYRLISDFGMFQFRTRGGVCIPLVLQTKSGFLGVLPIEGEEPTRSDLAQASSFLNTHNRSKLVFVHLQKRFEVLSDRLLVAPLAATV